MADKKYNKGVDQLKYIINELNQIQVVVIILSSESS